MRFGVCFIRITGNACNYSLQLGIRQARSLFNVKKRGGWKSFRQQFPFPDQRKRFGYPMKRDCMQPMQLSA